MKKIVKKLLEKISSDKEDFIVSANQEIKIEEKYFHQIQKGPAEQKLISIDGGSMELFHSPSLSLFFNRVYYNIYCKGKRLESQLYEFFTLIHIIKKENNLAYRVEISKKQGEFTFPMLEFSINDSTLAIGNNQVEISRIGDAVRRFSEIIIASSIKEKNSILLMDGSLEAKYSFEMEYLKELFNSSESVVCSLSKSNSDITSKGNSTVALISSLRPNGEWYYGPISSSASRIDKYYVKLNPASKYVFGLDVFNSKEIIEIVMLLRNNSTDPVFLGYPYALIEADRFARVSKQEATRLKLRIEAMLGRDCEKLVKYSNAENAHDILDNIS